MTLKKRNYPGFTLVELLLAMAIFTTVMIITTTGFIAMNRSFTRGTVRKQLSEGVQRTSEDVTRVVRAFPQKTGKAFSCIEGDPRTGECPTQSDGSVVCLTGARYFWSIAAEENGLFKDEQECNKPLDPNGSLTTKLIDTRYRVVSFDVVAAGASGATDDVHLFTISGTFRTADDYAFDTSNINDPNKVKCRGSAQSSAVRTCAVERFNFTINARGDTT